MKKRTKGQGILFHDLENAKIKQEVMKIYNNKYRTNDSKEFLSNYARSNDAEWFAETFTNLQLAEKPEPIALALGEYLNKSNK